MVETLVKNDQAESSSQRAQGAARGRVLFDAQWCRTCRVCEVACSIAREGQANPALARMNVAFNEFERETPVTGLLCAQCEDAPCLTACPNEAMNRDARTGALVVDEEKCNGCMRCRRACTWRIPKRHPERKVAIKCDLCGDREGGPVCVAMCPLSGKALRYEPDYYVQAADQATG